MVPDSAAAQPPKQLFLPFADSDLLTSAILSKVLLLAAHARITEPGILS